MKYYFFILISSILISCTTPTLDKETPAINEIKVREKFNIILPENHDEGFMWKLTGEPNKTLIDNMGAVWHGNDKGVYYRFTALQSGTDTLSFTLFKTDMTTKERDSVKSAVYIVKILP